MDQAKIFVIDTNVILHDSNCIYKFENNDVVIPITVLEELDKFKKGTDQINFQARQFVRTLDELIKDDVFKEGTSLGQDKGKLFIETGKPYSKEFKESFKEDIPDHRILAIAQYIQKSNESRRVIFVTKDVNLRMKAKSLGIDSEDFKNDKIKDLKSVYKGIRTLDSFDGERIDELYQEGTTIFDPSSISPVPFANEFFILKNSHSSALARYNRADTSFKKVDKLNAFGIKPRNAEQTLSFNALLDPDIKLMSITGKAGTGKTLLALAAAIEQNQLYDQILLARPIVALSNKDLGFLPGDANEKISPYMAPLFDNLAVIKRSFKSLSKEVELIKEMQDDERLLITPLAYIRGRSLSNCYFIIDEAQNLTPHEIKTIITRAGENTKMIFTGDIQQIDSPYLDEQSNGLTYLTDRMKNQEIFAHVHLVKGERSHLAELASDLL